MGWKLFKQVIITTLYLNPLNTYSVSYLGSLICIQDQTFKYPLKI